MAAPDASRREGKRGLIISCMDPRLTAYLDWFRDMKLKTGEYESLVIRRNAGGRVFPLYVSDSEEKPVGAARIDDIRTYVKKRGITEVILAPHGECKAVHHIQEVLQNGKRLDSITRNEVRMLRAAGFETLSFGDKRFEQNLGEARFEAVRAVLDNVAVISLNYISASNFDLSGTGKRPVCIVSEDEKSMCGELISKRVDPKEVLAYVVRGSPAHALSSDIGLAKRLGVEILPNGSREDLAGLRRQEDGRKQIRIKQ